MICIHCLSMRADLSRMTGLLERQQKEAAEFYAELEAEYEKLKLEKFELLKQLREREVLE